MATVPHPSAERRPEAGFSLIEVLIASMLLLFIVIGVLPLFSRSMINNLQVTTENLSASESRIRDTDMAQEMVSFTKNQVLQQAGTAMLSQANQIPQTILSLLR